MRSNADADVKVNADGRMKGYIHTYDINNILQEPSWNYRDLSNNSSTVAIISKL